MTILLDITPVPKPRQTRADKWQKRPSVMRYRAFADEVRLKMPKGVDLNYSEIKFYLPMPMSWSIKKKLEMLNQPHMQRPDIDNLAKAFFDALYEDDSHIHTIGLVKRWGNDGVIKIETI